MNLIKCIFYFSFNLKFFTKHGVTLSVDQVLDVSETVLQCKSSFYPWCNVPKESYSVSQTTTSTILELNDTDNNSKFMLRLFILDTNGNVFKISISSLDLSKFFLNFNGFLYLESINVYTTFIFEH